MTEFEVCRQRTPEEQRGVREAEIKRTCPCRQGTGPGYATCEARDWSPCDTTNDMWWSR